MLAGTTQLHVQRFELKYGTVGSVEGKAFLLVGVRSSTFPFEIWHHMSVHVHIIVHVGERVAARV